jgi:hypothetical protein
MEDLIKNDATFELYHNSEGAEILNNRTLTTYPSEKSSFQVFLGFEGEETKPKTDTTKTKPTYDPEKIAQGVTATAGAISSVGSTIQAFKGDGTKAPSRRKQLKDVCGRKPVLKKNRGTYDKCVADYNAGKVGGSTRMAEPPPTETKTEETPPTDNKKRNIIIGVVVVGVLVTAFIGYKKGWFGKKAG